MEIKFEVRITFKRGSDRWIAISDYPFDLTCSSYTQKEAEMELHHQVALKIRELDESGELEAYLKAHQIAFVKAETITRVTAHYDSVVRLHS